ncbi:MAG: c-type cytochrome [Akkermansiaceae bacterium]|nr:c-type cytochrome [Akkermansiaceae bacterium]
MKSPRSHFHPPSGLRPWRAVLFALLVTGGVGHAQSPVAPVIPGLHGKHPLNEAQRGALLIGELRCAACHDGMSADHMKEAPDLRGAGSRLTPGFMARFIADPFAVHPGTTMPDVLGAETPEKRREAAASIAAYLSSRKIGPAPEPPEGEVDAYDGKELFHQIGCVACHSPRNEAVREVIGEGVIPLTHLPGKYRPGALAEFLHAPLEVRPSGRMPDMKLGKMEAASLAAYLEGESSAVPDRAATEAARIEAGRLAFQKYNCTACHQAEEEPLPVSSPGPARGKLDLSRGCLSDAPGAAPDFHLDASQRRAIRKALEAPMEDAAPAEQVKMHLTRMNCIACHVRDDFGGVAQKLDSYFRSSEEALGNESRIPPPLTLVGAKLRPEWMNAVLYDGRVVRPYMKTRMPQFGEAALAGLTELLAEVDHLDPVELPEPDRESRPMMRNGAHLLLGDKGLNCIACHNYNGKESPGMKGLDLMTSYQRLQPAWFYNYMLDPGAFRPGILMPGYWPNGKAVQTEILDGDTDLQLRALWHNFSLGRSARDPSGLRSEPSVLVVTDAPRTYRGRSSVAGYRGIAVGFPGGWNYAFNAQNGALSAIWKGEFIRVGWQGQGSGNFNPIGKPVQLAQDVAFLPLPDATGAWPLRPRTSKEQPVNPDPLYPRKHGYAFLGYSLDEDSVPTFRYRCGPVEIEDRSVTAGTGEGMSLRRAFRFSAPAQTTVMFRALAGSIESESPTVFRTDAVRITIAPGKTRLRPAADGKQELLIELPLPKGESTFTLDYELLR